jgi:hypothetical protein
MDVLIVADETMIRMMTVASEERKASSYLAEKPSADENALSIEGLRYRRSVKEFE